MNSMHCRHLINRSLLAIAVFVSIAALGACNTPPAGPPVIKPSTIPVTEYNVSSSTTPPAMQAAPEMPPAGSDKTVTSIDPVDSVATTVDTVDAAAAAAAPAAAATAALAAPAAASTATSASAAAPPVMGPLFIVTGSDGKLWFTDFDGSSVNSFDPVSLDLANYFYFTPDRNPTRLTIGPDGNFWFDETGPMSPGLRAEGDRRNSY